MADMEPGGGFVVEDEDELVGYFAFLPSPEATYAKIYDGQWLDDERRRSVGLSGNHSTRCFIG